MSDRDTRIALVSDASALAFRREFRAAAGLLSGLLEIDFDPDVAALVSRLERAIEQGGSPEELARLIRGLLSDDELRDVDSRSTTRPAGAAQEPRRDAFTTAPRAPVDGPRPNRTADAIRALFRAQDGVSDPLTETGPSARVRAPEPIDAHAESAPQGRRLDDDLETFDFAEASATVSGAHLAVRPHVVHADARVATPSDPAPAARVAPESDEASTPSPPAFAALHTRTPRVAPAEPSARTGRFAPVAPQRASPAAEILDRVRHMVSRGDLASAEQLVGEVLLLDPGSGAAQQLQRDIGAKLSMLRMAALEPLDRVPRRTAVAPTAAFSPRSMFLVSQVDGVSTLRDIIDLSGMPAREAADLLADLIATGAVQF